MRLLFAEDEPELRAITVQRLKSEGFSVDGCADGQEALEFAEGTDYNLIILDIMMPKLDGLSVVKRLRQNGNTTLVLLLTAKDAVSDRVAGLDAGADDYLTKPYAFDELLARIRALLRRQSPQKSDCISAGDLTLCFSSKRVTRGGKEITLSAKEFSLLESLMRHKGSVLSRLQLENQVWDYDFDGGSNVIDVYIRYLRRKIDDPFEKKLIHTVRGAGYVLKEE